MILQSGFLDIYSGPEFHFWEWISLGDSCERGFFLFEGWRGNFLDIFQNIYLSHLNVWSCSAFLFLQLCNSLHTAQAWFCELYMRWPFMPGSHIGPFHLQCVCSPCVVPQAVQKQHWLCFHTGVCNWSVAVYHKHNIYPLFWFQIQTVSLKMLFQHCDYFFTPYSNTIFHRRV